MKKLIKHPSLIGSDEEGLVTEKNGETWEGVGCTSSPGGGFSSQWAGSCCKTKKEFKWAIVLWKYFVTDPECWMWRKELARAMR